LLFFIILALTALWLFSFFGQTRFPNILHSGVFIDTLAAAIIVLIMMQFLSWT
jgi:hydrogenase-4 membrane subunit HyfE